MSRPPDAGDLITRLRAAGCVFAEDEAALLLDATQDQAELAALIARRIAGEPLEYVLGWAEFCGLRIAVRDGVFVPRRRTELLAQQAITLLRPFNEQHPIVVDLCCGSGALGAAVAAAAPQLDLYATDIDPVAVACARGNLPPPVHVYDGDLFQALPTTLRGRIDLLLANVPYVPTEAIATMPSEARDHEPRHTLDGGADGLTVLRRVTAVAQSWLAPGGHLLIETSRAQAPLAIESFTDAGLITRIVADPELGATVVIGTAFAPAR